MTPVSGPIELDFGQIRGSQTRSERNEIPLSFHHGLVQRYQQMNLFGNVMTTCYVILNVTLSCLISDYKLPSSSIVLPSSPQRRVLEKS